MKEWEREQTSIRGCVQHVLDRMQCLEPDKPSQDLIDYIKSVLDIKNLEHTKKNIRLCLFGEERWHLIYVWRPCMYP